LLCKYVQNGDPSPENLKNSDKIFRQINSGYFAICKTSYITQW